MVLHLSSARDSVPVASPVKAALRGARGSREEDGMLLAFKKDTSDNEEHTSSLDIAQCQPYPGPCGLDSADVGRAPPWPWPSSLLDAVPVAHPRTNWNAYAP